jgi:bifunctional enzyme CysN/CysC/sulfate adenylyltransferase subunit 1
MALQGEGCFALSSTGLQPEREQASASASPIAVRDRQAQNLRDTPATSNAATAVGASTMELIILYRRAQGILPQTRRRGVITSMFSVRHVVVAVNKMDLVGYAGCSARSKWFSCLRRPSSFRVSTSRRLSPRMA